MSPAYRNIFLPLSIGGLLLFLSAAPGCCKRCIDPREKGAPGGTSSGTERTGVTVTQEVPHSKETISEIRDRERTNPLPPRGDTAIHSHKIHRTGNDNGMSNPPGDDPTEK